MNRQSVLSVNLHQPTLLILGVILALLVSMLPAASQNSAPMWSLAKMQPELRVLASQQPDRMVPVIVQRAADSAEVTTLIQKLGGRVIYDLYMVNALAADLPAGTLARLAASPMVGRIFLDGTISGSAVSLAPLDKKNNPGDPVNTYRDTLGVNQLTQTGAGITIAILDSGVANDPDFGNRVVARVSFNRDNPNQVTDRFGHGTHIAGIVAGSGGRSNGLYAGIAPEANLVSVKIGGDDGTGYESDAAAAIQWVLANRVAYGIRVANMSINSDAEMSYHASLMNMMVEFMRLSGIVVVASAGNVKDGNHATINSAPANDPFVITVGATTEIDDIDGLREVVANYSASGITLDDHAKPELVAPGTNIVSVLAATSKWKQDHPKRVVAKTQYFRASGTSMSAPMVSGAAALVLQANGGLTPGQVKCVLMESASELNGVKYLDIQAAVNAAPAGATCTDPNAGTPPSILIGPVLDVVLDDDFNWSSIDWNSIDWKNSINWNSINWNSINWNSINWNSINWNSINWNSMDSVTMDSPINWNSINWNSVILDDE